MVGRPELAAIGRDNRPKVRREERLVPRITALERRGAGELLTSCAGRLWHEHTFQDHASAQRRPWTRSVPAYA